LNDSFYVLFTLLCRETGLDCDIVIKGKTIEEFLKNGANHATQKHGIHADDIYLNDIPINLLCHSFSEENRED
jgi:predicted small metal-binding protein